jgi:hypothetical protein
MKSHSQYHPGPPGIGVVVPGAPVVVDVVDVVVVVVVVGMGVVVVGVTPGTTYNFHVPLRLDGSRPEKLVRYGADGAP